VLFCSIPVHILCWNRPQYNKFT